MASLPNLNKQPAFARPSASLLIVRDGVNGLEVLVVRRNPELRVAGGFLVYPGGVLDASDQFLSESDDELEPFRINAIRETFEEIGVLYGSAEGDLLSGRKQLLSGELSFQDFAINSQLCMQLGALHHFAHWIAPELLKVRFSTHFFIAVYNQEVIDVDGGEIVGSYWMSPRELLAKDEDRQETLMFPTLMNARRLMPFASVAELLVYVEHLTVDTIMPVAEYVGDDIVITVPEAANLGVTQWRFPNPL